jgi:hypothetical protein
MPSFNQGADLHNRSNSGAVQIWKAGALYFALVFAAGFVLGAVRIGWLVPRFGERIAELMEMPLMLGVIIVAAQWTVRQYALVGITSHQLGIGCIALVLLLVTEVSVVLSLRGLSISEYFSRRDPVSGAVYWLMLGVFAIMPALIRR